MPRGRPKRGAFEFTIWFADGGRISWASTRPHTDAEIGAFIRTQLEPVAKALEQRAPGAEREAQDHT